MAAGRGARAWLFPSASAPGAKLTEIVAVVCPEGPARGCGIMESRKGLVGLQAPVCLALRDIGLVSRSRFRSGQIVTN